MDETIDAPVVETPDAKLADITAAVAKVERQRDRYKKLVEESCLDAISAALAKFGCTLRAIPGGMVEVKANEVE